MDTLTLDPTPTPAPDTAWRDIAIFADGTRSAGAQHDLNLQYLTDRIATQKLMELFIAKHATTLAGAYWRTGIIDPEIRICHRRYRGETSSPQAIAKLWPDAQWRRAKDKYNSDPCYHWEATIDGCTVRIEQAEVYDPTPLPKVGELIKL